MGVTFFDQLNEYFKDNYDVLAEDFLKVRKPGADISKEVKQEVLNLHEAHVNELKTNFMAALGRDRMYKRPCGAVTDQQIWMLGVLTKYFVKQVLNFSHNDFLTAFRVDLGPILGETGLWALKNYQQRQLEKGKEDKKVRARVAIDLVSKYLESGFEVLGQIKKYESSNRFCPKRSPDKQVLRSEIKFIYSWIHYAPHSWFQEQRKLEEDVKATKENKGAPLFNLCSYCSTPES